MLLPRRGRSGKRQRLRDAKRYRLRRPSDLYRPFGPDTVGYGMKRTGEKDCFGNDKYREGC